MGRLLKIKGIPNSYTHSNWFGGTEHTIAENQYDALGHLKKKNLAPDYNSNAGIETLNYGYNIRNWLTGINNEYVKDSINTHWFGFQLGYDNAVTGIGSAAYTNPHYNGNISGMIWKSGGDQEKTQI